MLGFLQPSLVLGRLVFSFLLCITIFGLFRHLIHHYFVSPLVCVCGCFLSSTERLTLALYLSRSANESTAITSTAADPSSTGKHTSSATSIHSWSWSGSRGQQYGFWSPSRAAWDRVWDVQRTKQIRVPTPLTTFKVSKNEYVTMVPILPVIHTLMMILRPLYDYLIWIFAIGTSPLLYVVVPLGLCFIGRMM
jgi:hypothetical protein